MKYLLVIPLFLVCSGLNAQDSKYFVFLFKGDVRVKQPGRAPAKAKPRQYLSLNDTVFLKTETSEITIGNTKGSWLVIKEKGAYKMSELLKREPVKGAGSTAKFLGFLYHELLHPQKANKVNQESIAASWGGGTRGACNYAKGPPDNLVSSKDTITFRWRHSGKTLNYTFILYNSEGDELFNCIVRDSQLVVNTNSLRTADRTSYSWSVNSISQPCKTATKYLFDLVFPGGEDQMATELIKDVPFNDNEILYNLAITDVLGRNGLIDKALEYYNKSWLLLRK